MRRIAFVLVLILIINSVSAQQKDLRSHLYGLDKKIETGDSNALRKLASFLDDTSFVQEFLGYHNYPNNAKNIAIRIIRENTLLKNNEFLIDQSISARNFSNLLDTGKVVFDELTGTFLISPLKDRSTEYQLKALSKDDLERIDTTLNKKNFPEWFYENQIDWLIKRKNPEALMWIASAWFKKRSRFNRYYFNDEEFLDLIRKLIHIDLGIPDEKGKITFLYKDDYYAHARLNYLIYWVNHCKDYQWNDTLGYFENTTDIAKPKTEEEILFGLLNSETDSIAQGAFARLTELDTGTVNAIADQYESNNIHRNFSIPIFAYRFLKQMVFLTQYCRDHNVKYKPEGWVLDSLNRFRQNLEFSQRYRLENHLIEKLDLKQITMVEYFGLVNEQDWNTTYSIGRVLDKFYSRKWNEVLSDTTMLQLYLKKSALFNRLGIIGNCNKFTRKFGNNNIEALGKVTAALYVQDKDVQGQAKKIIDKNTGAIIKRKTANKTWEGNSDAKEILNPSQEYSKIMSSSKKTDDKRYALLQLFGRVSYNQLGEAIQILAADTSLKNYDKYHFLKSDFGFTIDVNDQKQISEFSTLHQTKSERLVYEHFLKETGMDCFSKNDSLNYAGVYEVLKYNVVDAFVGGGGSRRDEGVYLAIKLLEIRFSTTLGFPKKLCSWQGIYGCDCGDRAKAWMQFLEEAKLVDPDKSEPVSISSND